MAEINPTKENIPVPSQKRVEKPAPPFDSARVHVFGDRSDGSQGLIGTNLYKRFVRKSAEGNTEIYNIQYGRWYFGTEPVKRTDVPDWVWVECRSMTEAVRRTYQILLPEERRKGIKPAALNTANILKALVALDPHQDEDWDADGQPSLDAVARILGTYVPRELIRNANPFFVRPGAAESEDENEEEAD